MCTSRKVPSSPAEEIRTSCGWGGAFWKTQTFKEMCTALLEFPKGGSWYFLELHINVFSCRASGFHMQVKLFELNFIIGKPFHQMVKPAQQNHPTAGQFEALYTQKGYSAEAENLMVSASCWLQCYIPEVNLPGTWPFMKTSNKKSFARSGYMVQNHTCWWNAPAFDSEVSLRNLLSSLCDFLPCNQVVQRPY